MLYKYLCHINYFLKSIFSVKSFFLLRLSTGIYTEISDHRIINLIVKVYCVACNIYNTVYILDVLQYLPMSARLGFISQLAMYWVYSLISLFTNPKRFSTYLYDLKTVDNFMGVTLDTDIPITRILVIIILINGVYGNYAFSTFQFLRSARIISYVIKSYIGMVKFMMCLPQLVVFELLWYRMRAVKKCLEKLLTEFTRLENIREFKYSLRNFMLNYTKLLDSVKNTGAPMKTMVNTIK